MDMLWALGEWFLQSLAIVVSIIMSITLLAALDEFLEMKAHLALKAKRPSAFPYVQSQLWRETTDIRLIENLKKGLTLKESRWLRKQDDAMFFAKGWEERREKSGCAFWLFHRRVIFAKEQYEEQQGECLNLCAKLDRLWSGNARLELGDLQVEILKLKRRRQDLTGDEYSREVLSIDERVIELERDVRDMEELVKRAQAHPYQEKFEDKKTRRGFDVQDEVFEARVIIELRAKYNELQGKIENHPTMSREQKVDLLRELDRRFNENMSKDKEKRRFNV
jgi:hypothetical protein